MRRKRRGSNGTWLPVLPTILEQNEPQGPQFATFYETSYEGPFGQPQLGDVLAVPLLPDTTEANDSQGVGSLRDLVEGQDYVLKRTVGKVWVSASQATEPTGQANGPYIVCVALAVLPVDDDAPGTVALDSSDYAPLDSRNSQQPWLWRRTWVLQNTINAAGLNFPAVGAQSTWQYGSIADGGHLDTKVARRVSKEQRMFIIFQASNLFPENGDFGTSFRFGYDLRFFGAMRKSRNVSSFK